MLREWLEAYTNLLKRVRLTNKHGLESAVEFHPNEKTRWPQSAGCGHNCERFMIKKRMMRGQKGSHHDSAEIISQDPAGSDTHLWTVNEWILSVMVRI
jgi:hypothetical protein